MKMFDVFIYDRKKQITEWVTDVYVDTLSGAFDAVKASIPSARCMGFVEYSVIDGAWVETDRKGAGS